MTRNSPSSGPPERRSIEPHAVALTIAGSDPSGGAGLQADLKTFQQLGVYGMSVVTLVTAQNTKGVRRVEVLPADLVTAQLDAVLQDIPPRAIKIGALGSAEIVRAVGERLANVRCPIVVDPVLVSKHGHSLADADVAQAYQKHLLRHAWLVTPNRFEAEKLTGIPLDTEANVTKAIGRLELFGPRHVLLKVGEVDGQSQHVLSVAKNKHLVLATPRLDSDNTHGTGCILAAAITARLALGEADLKAAVLFGIRRTLEAIHVNSRLGHGVHPAEIRAMFDDEE